MAKYKGGFGGGMGNMNNMIRQAQKLQQQMEETQKEVSEKEFEVTSAVKMVINGKREFVKMELDKEIVDPEDIEMLQDTILTAVNEAMRTADKEMNDAMGKLTGGVNMPGIF